MGAGGAGAEYLAAIRSDQRLALQAVADTSADVLRKHAEPLGVRTYQDHRSLLAECAQTGLDLLVVALEPYESLPFVEMAATRGIPVLHKPPFARNLREGDRLVDLFEGRDCPFVVSRSWQNEPAFSPLMELARPVTEVLLATAHVHTTDTAAGWRGDAGRAGGGVLLNGAYEAVDLLVHLLGQPETVYARCATAPVLTHPGERHALYEYESRRPAPADTYRSSRTHDTEDVALASMDFGRLGIASVTALRAAPEAEWRVALMRADTLFELNTERMTITSRDGGEPQRYTVWTKHPVSHTLGAFASFLLGEKPVVTSTAREHLATLAAIESAYLSAKTGEPESPARLF